VAANIESPDVLQEPAPLEELYIRYRAQLKHFFVLRGRRQDAEDLMQEIFFDLVRRPPPAELRDARRYLYQVAWNTLKDKNRRERREPPQVSASDAPNALWIEDDTTALFAPQTLIRTLRGLPRVVQIAVLRNYRDERSYREIAEELGCTTHAVKKYISRALNQFRKQVGGS